MKTNIQVFQDENASHCFIIGTDDVVEAEEALREAEEGWYGPIEKRDMSTYERPMDFAAFDRQTFYLSGENIFLSKEAAKGTKGRLAIREGFLAPLD